MEPSEIIINGKKLSDILESHALWLREPAGQETHECARLECAHLEWARLECARLEGASLECAHLEGAHLEWAHLEGAHLEGAHLEGANLSRSIGLLTARKWMTENLERDELGYLCYKRIGDTEFYQPSSWVIAPGSFIEEVVNPCPTIGCACGVNVGTRHWCDTHYQGADLWKCRIRWEDLPDVVVPYNTDGKFRCGRLELIEKVV